MYDFNIEFQIPYREDNNSKVRYKTINKEYKDVFVQPRRNSEIVRIIVDLIPFFYKWDDNGELHHYTREEYAEIYDTMDAEIIDRLYDLVARVLGIDMSLKNYMVEESVWAATANIINQYKATINEGKTFFPKSSEGRSWRTEDGRK